MAIKLTVLDRIKKHYAKTYRDLGALSEFSRALGIDPRSAHQWQRLNRAVPAIHGAAIEKLMNGEITAAEVVAEDVAYLTDRFAEKLKRRKGKEIARRKKQVTGGSITAPKVVRQDGAVRQQKSAQATLPGIDGTVTKRERKGLIQFPWAVAQKSESK